MIEDDDLTRACLECGAVPRAPCRGRDGRPLEDFVHHRRRPPCPSRAELRATWEAKRRGRAPEETPP